MMQNKKKKKKYTLKIKKITKHIVQRLRCKKDAITKHIVQRLSCGKDESLTFAKNNYNKRYKELKQ